MTTLTPEKEAELPEVLAGHWDTPEGREMAMRYANEDRPAPHLGSDLHLANAAYMELHEPLGTGTKERMRWLSVQLALAQARLSTEREGRERAQAEREVLIKERDGREAADARYNARWARDPLMKRLDDIRQLIAGMRPDLAEALAEHQSRTLTAEAQISALQAELAQWNSDNPPDYTQIKALRAQIAEKNEALRPFAAEADDFDSIPGEFADDEVQYTNVPVGAYRRAHAALNFTEKQT